jgi:hypothetical protein
VNPKSSDVIDAEYGDGGAVLDKMVSIAEPSPEEES